MSIVISQISNQESVSTILVRYCEIGLKSTPVRRRFETILRNNMLTMLASAGVEALVSYADARFYIESDEIDRCVEAVKKVFGIASLSVTEVCSSDMDDICATVADYSVGRLKEGDTFALKVRREGSQPYSSVDVGREAGSAVFERNEHMGVTVDLTNPDHTFYVEVRNNKAYVFDEYVPCPGGLPLNSQGRVVARLESERDAVSAWMMMKRGCKVIASGDCCLDLIREYDPTLRIDDDDKDKLGVIMGTSIDDIDKVDVSQYDVPVFFPTIAMSDEEVKELLGSIRTHSF